MSRLLLLLPFLIWMSRNAPARHPAELLRPTLLFFGFYLLLIACMGAWARLLARQVTDDTLHRNLRRFNRVMMFARLAVPAWFGAAVYFFSWDAIVKATFPTLAAWPVLTPILLIGTAPAFVAWAGLWWAQFPADLALKEQGVLTQLENDIPVYHPQRLPAYLLTQLRLQLLFTLLPVLLILVVHDVITLAFKLLSRSAQIPETVQAVALFSSTVVVFVIAPELLRRILKTRPLPASDLRNKLQAMCVINGLKYREILLWETNSQMGNAAVMGVLPRVRYILLSDLLLETMTDEQVEAVFAHELGHIVHRHMAWYVVLFLILFCIGAIFEAQLTRFAPALPNRDLWVLMGGVVMFIFGFGFVSRRFERQADVFAARTVQMIQTPATLALPMHSFVGRVGARVMAGTLQRVAIINNMPTTSARLRNRRNWPRPSGLIDWLVDNANHWLHGSIATRVQALHTLSTDPAHTTQFDRKMTRLYIALLCTLCLVATWTIRQEM